MTDITSNFNAAPLGPFTTANKLLAWPGQTINDNDPNGSFFSIVTGGKTGGHCCRMHYLKGGFGQSSTRYYRINIHQPQDVVNLEFDWLFEDNFDFVAGGPNADGGKIGPRMYAGGITTGTNMRVEFGLYSPLHFNCYRSHLTDGSGTRYPSPFNHVTGVWYHIEMTLKTGPEGYARMKIDEGLIFDVGPDAWDAITDTITIDFSTFFGGGGSASAPTYDCYARMDNVHIWTGVDTPANTITALPAAYVSPATIVASSIERDRVGQITAFGGTEFGYAYKFSLDGTQPAGVIIDADTGVLTLGTAVSQGNHPLGIIVTNIRQPTVSATFTVNLSVVPGVIANRTGNQILHKAYDPHSGAYGNPTGNDWTAVFDLIATTIIGDQITAGDGLLRAYLPLRGNIQYDYHHNRWPCGIQFLKCYQDSSYPGAKPKLRCIQSTYSYDLEVAIMQAGGGSFLDFFVANPASKTWQCRIKEAGLYLSAVTLKTPSDASKLRVGRWHMICSYDQQASGGPPNCRYYDYVKVSSVNPVTGLVVLDRRTRHRHSETYWERYPQDDFSFGEARIMPMDVAGSGGVEPGTNIRLTQRQTWQNIEFVVNPTSLPGDLGKFVYTQGIDTYFENCVIPYAVPSVTQHISYIGCTFANRIEADKLIETLVMDNCTVNGEGVGSSTGVELWLARNSTIGKCTSSPRQMRCIGTTFDITASSPINVNSYLIWTGIPGPLKRCDFDDTTFIAENVFTTGQIMPMRDTPSYGLILGTDGSWRTSSQIQIPVTSAKFLYYLGMCEVGTILSLSSDPQHIGSSWGYVQSITSPGNGTALWLNIIWVAGTRPTSGTLYFSREHETLILPNCTLGNVATTWIMNGSYQQTVPSAFGTSYTFPALYPVLYQG